MASGFVLVKFKVDGMRMNRPASFVKNFRPDEFVPENTYEVFWSPRSKDTPDTIMLSQGRVLCLDDIPDKSCSSSSGAGPQAGYYRAMVLKYASTEQELEEQTLQKRVSVPSIKKLESQSSQKTSNVEKPADKRISRAKQKKIVAEGETQTLKDYERKRKRTPSPCYSSSSDDLTPRKPYREKINTLSEESKRYRRKYYDVMAKYSTAKEENKQLKEEMKKWKMENQTKHKVTYKSATKDKEISQIPMDCALPESGQEEQTSKKEAQEEVEIQPKESDPSDQPAHQIEQARQIDEAQHIDEAQLIDEAQHTDQAQEIDGTPNNEGQMTQERSEGTSVPTVYENFISESGQQKKILWRVRKGEPGDSQFTKNLASAIYTNEVLAESSVTGTRALNQTDSVARPKLDEQKMIILKQLFEERMNGEDPKPSKDAMNARKEKVFFYVDQKIQTLRRPSRAAPQNH